ncbi:MAG: hypothetical protein IJW71_01685 [Clostridia bacterium]|nr:hypothetical protein [Clostridia bacterium]
MNAALAYLLQTAVREHAPSLFCEGALLRLYAPLQRVSLAHGVYESEAGDLPLCGGELPSGAWTLADGIGYTMPIEYACGWRTDEGQPDQHTPQYISLPAELFPDGDFTLIFTAALTGMDYAQSGHYIKSNADESEHCSYLLQTPNLSVYTKHACKTEELSRDAKIPVTAFYHFYDETGEWKNPSTDLRISVENQPFFERLKDPCTYQYSVAKENGTATVCILIRDPLGGVLFHSVKDMPCPATRGAFFRFALDVPVRLYSLSLYPRVLSEEEEMRERFAMLVDRFALNTRALAVLPAAAQSRVQNAVLQTVSLTDSHARAEAEYEAAIAAEGESL